ncbi:MAG: hypothetical protein ACRCYA_04110 [Cetobacterium sp.]
MPKLEEFLGFVPCSFIDANNDQFKPVATGDVMPNRIPLETLNSSNENDTPASVFFDTKTMNVSFEGELTNRITDGAKYYNTNNIGQTQDAQGNNLLSNGKQLLMSGKHSLVSMYNEDKGFIIDSINIQAVFNGDYSIEFLDNNGSIV